MKYQFIPFSVEYEQITSPVADFKTECIIAAHKAILENHYNLPIVVMMSGGIDSQLVAESLLLADIPFKCVIGRFQHETSVNSNRHDYEYAERWCKLNNVDMVYCDINLLKHEESLIEYALSAKSFSPQYACHMYIMKWCTDNNLFFIAGNGEMDIVLHDGEYCMMDEQREFALDNFCELNKLAGVFQFWKQDARLISSFLQLDMVKLLMATRMPRLLDYKHACFSNIFKFEDRTKKTGFELIQGWDASLRNKLKITAGNYDEKFYTPITYFNSI